MKRESFSEKRFNTAYRTDLAYIHDKGFGDFVRGSAPGLLDMISRYRIPPGLVVDLGCGSGIWAADLSKAGYDVLGIDISKAMIALAKKRAPAATFKVESFFKVPLPECVAVTSLGECVNYLFDPDNSPNQLGRLFGRVYDALPEGGLFVFDFVQPGHLGTARYRKDFQSGSDWSVLTEVRENSETKQLTRSIILYRRVNRLYRRTHETHQLRLYSASVLAAELRRIGFRVRIVRGYGRWRFSGTHRGILARKDSRSRIHNKRD